MALCLASTTQAGTGTNHILSAIDNGDVATIQATQDEGIFKKKGLVLIRAALEGIYKNNPQLGKAVVKALLDKSLMFLDANDPQVKALLVLASERGCVELVEGLLKHGVDKHTVSELGQTALHVAVQAAEFEAAQLLLEHGVDPNIACNLGLTALHLAGINGREDFIALLLKFGAMVKNACSKGFTAFHYAKMNQHKKASKLLKHA